MTEKIIKMFRLISDVLTENGEHKYHLYIEDEIGTDCVYTCYSFYANGDTVFEKENDAIYVIKQLTTTVLKEWI